MVIDDGLDLWPEMREAFFGKVRSGQALGRFQIVESPGCPDTKIMKGGGDLQEVGIAALLRRKKEQIVQNTVDVIPVGAQILAKGTGVRTQNVIDPWKGSAKIHGSAQRLIASIGGDKLLLAASQPKMVFFLTAPQRY